MIEGSKTAVISV